ncbi:MAG: DUF4136 domain-containing protein [Myxococcota bacterium]|nr:DUF4136 domain-containing protein [Myxococcota bacterium]
MRTWILLGVGLIWLLGSFGCAFEGYVPPPPPLKPLAESEMDIRYLPMGKLRTAQLTCDEGICRLRYRIVAPSSGEMTVTVKRAASEEPLPGRIGRVVLEGVGEQTLAIQNADNRTPPFVVSSRVQPGVHYVLIQSLNGGVNFKVQATFSASAQAVVEAGTFAAQPKVQADSTRLAGAQARDAAIVSQPNGNDAAAAGELGTSDGHRPHDDRPGNTSDGADFGYDPSRDLSQMKSYAFAQDPAKMLKGKPGSVQTNVFVLRQVQREVTYALTEKGLESLPVKEADFLIVIDLGQRTTAWYSASPMILPFTYNDYFSQWRQMDSVSVPPYGYMEGKLGISFVDRKTGSLLWHGWTTQGIPIAQETDAQLKKAVDKVLAQY